jgi:hypothetical protein
MPGRIFPSTCDPALAGGCLFWLAALRRAEYISIAHRPQSQSWATAYCHFRAESSMSPQSWTMGSRPKPDRGLHWDPVPLEPIETGMEFLPHPREPIHLRELKWPRPKPAKLAIFFTGTDNPTHLSPDSIKSQYFKPDTSSSGPDPSSHDLKLGNPEATFRRGCAGPADGKEGRPLS